MTLAARLALNQIFCATADELGPEAMLVMTPTQHLAKFIEIGRRRPEPEVHNWVDQWERTPDEAIDCLTHRLAELLILPMQPPEPRHA